MAPVQVLFKSSKLGEDNAVQGCKDNTGLWLFDFSIYKVLLRFPLTSLIARGLCAFLCREERGSRHVVNARRLLTRLVLKSPDYFRDSSILCVTGFIASVPSFLAHREALSVFRWACNALWTVTEAVYNGKDVCSHLSSWWKWQSPWTEELSTKQAFCLLWNIHFD